jgi:type IV secretory pathway VirB10-like protein
VDGERHGRTKARWTTAIPALLLAIAGLFSARSAGAEGKLTLNGTWSASSLTEAWSVSEWGEECGPKPAGKGAGGGSVQVQEQGGELSILGAGRAFSTTQCWEQMPGLARTSHSASGGGRFWRTRCSSPANDPRHATVTTTIQASDSAMSLSETGQYQWRINDTTCSASVSRSRSFSLVKREGEEAPAASASASAAPVASATAAPKPPPEPKPEPRPAAKCVAGSAGEPARLEVHPARKLLRAGEKFAFRAAVLDAEGCPTGARPTWSLAPGPVTAKASIDAAGTLAVEASADEGKLDVVASILGKSVTVHVEVASADHYDALLAARGVESAGDESEAAVAVIATGTIGGRTAVADDSARRRKTTFLAIVVGLSLALGFVALVLVRRGRRPEPEAESEGEVGAPRGDAPGEEAPPSLPEPPAPVAEPKAAGAPPPPLNAAPTAPKKAASRKKICPTCGEHYPSEAVFCGKDATSLVLVNG